MCTKKNTFGRRGLIQRLCSRVYGIRHTSYGIFSNKTVTCCSVNHRENYAVVTRMNLCPYAIVQSRPLYYKSQRNQQLPKGREIFIIMNQNSYTYGDRTVTLHNMKKAGTALNAPAPAFYRLILLSNFNPDLPQLVRPSISGTKYKPY